MPSVEFSLDPFSFYKIIYDMDYSIIWCPTDLHNQVCSRFLISSQGEKQNTNIYLHARNSNEIDKNPFKNVLSARRKTNCKTEYQQTIILPDIIII